MFRLKKKTLYNVSYAKEIHVEVEQTTGVFKTHFNSTVNACAQQTEMLIFAQDKLTETEYCTVTNAIRTKVQTVTPVYLIMLQRVDIVVCIVEAYIFLH